MAGHKNLFGNCFATLSSEKRLSVALKIDLGAGTVGIAPSLKKKLSLNYAQKQIDLVLLSKQAGLL